MVSGLNAVELNASFYRFPFPNQIKGWLKKTANSDTRWAIKVNRLITHIYKFGEKAFEVWTRFNELFKPLDRFVDFYLFQLPPSTTSKSLKNIEKFFENTKLKERFALEPRNLSFFEKDVLKNIEQMGMTFVSVDAPGLPRNICATTDAVYLRMHGRERWYSYCYSEEELKDMDYHHHKTWGDYNGGSHLRAMLIGPSLTVPFVEKRLTLGTWQQIVYINFDRIEKTRKIVLQISGEP